MPAALRGAVGPAAHGVDGVEQVRADLGPADPAAVAGPRRRRLCRTAGADRLGDVPFTGHTDWVTALATVSLPDGRTLLTTGSDDETVRLWDPATRHQIGKPKPVGMRVHSAAHIDGDVDAVGTPEGVVVLSLGPV